MIERSMARAQTRGGGNGAVHIVETITHGSWQLVAQGKAGGNGR